MNNRFQISYYPSYKDWANQLWLQGWPGYLCLVIAALVGIVTQKSDLAFYILLVSLLVLMFCVFGTVFYANSILEINEDGLTIIKNKKETSFNWFDISNIVFITPRGRASYREVIMVIYYQDNGVENIEYIVIESLYFKWANIKAAEIGCLIKHLEDHIFKIHKSNFYAPLFFKKRNLMPTIYS